MPATNPASQSPPDRPQGLGGVGWRQYNRHRPIRRHTSIKRLFISVTRLIALQSKILLTRSKLTLQRVIGYLVFSALAAIAAMAGVIFLYIGVFGLISSKLGPTYTFLIYAGAHLLLALIFFAVAKAKLKPNAVATGSTGGVAPHGRSA